MRVDSARQEDDRISKGMACILVGELKEVNDDAFYGSVAILGRWFTLKEIVYAMGLKRTLA